MRKFILLVLYGVKIVGGFGGFLWFLFGDHGPVKVMFVSGAGVMGAYLFWSEFVGDGSA